MIVKIVIVLLCVWIFVLTLYAAVTSKSMTEFWSKWERYMKPFQVVVLVAGLIVVIRDVLPLVLKIFGA
jgi:hypothetical protein